MVIEGGVNNAGWYHTVEVIVRDINGKRRTIECHDYDAEYILLNSGITDEDEILMVFYRNACIYSQLGNQGIDLEDIIGFFA